MAKSTQKQKILEMLKPGNWISSVDFVNAYMLRGPARIWDLRQEGYEIESRKVAGKSYDEYRLISKPVVELDHEKIGVQEEVGQATSSYPWSPQARETAHLSPSKENLEALQENNQTALW